MTKNEKILSISIDVALGLITFFFIRKISKDIRKILTLNDKIEKHLKKQNGE